MRNNKVHVPLQVGESGAFVSLERSEIHAKALAVLDKSSGAVLGEIAAPTLAEEDAALQVKVSSPHIQFVLLHLHRLAAVKRVRQLKALNSEDLEAVEETSRELKLLESSARSSGNDLHVRQLYVDTRIIHQTWQRVKIAEAFAMAQTKMQHLKKRIAKRDEEIEQLEARIELRAARRLQQIFRTQQMRREDFNVADNGSVVSRRIDQGEKTVKIQRTFRCFRARTTVKVMRGRKQAEDQREAAVEIQRVRRGQIGRRRVENQRRMREKERVEEAARKLQRFWRNAKEKEKSRERDLQELAEEWAGRLEDSATNVQRVARGWLCRRRRMKRRRQLLLGPRVKHLCQRFIAKGDLFGFIHAVNEDFEHHREVEQQIRAKEIDNAQVFIQSVMQQRKKEVDETWQQWLAARPPKKGTQIYEQQTNYLSKSRNHKQSSSLDDELQSMLHKLADEQLSEAPSAPYAKKHKASQLAYHDTTGNSSRIKRRPQKLKSLPNRPSAKRVFAIELPGLDTEQHGNISESDKQGPLTLLEGNRQMKSIPPSRTPKASLEQLAYKGIEAFAMQEAQTTLQEPCETLLRNAFLRTAILASTNERGMLAFWRDLNDSEKSKLQKRVHQQVDSIATVLRRRGITTCKDLLIILTDLDLQLKDGDQTIEIPPEVVSYIKHVVHTAQRAATTVVPENVRSTWDALQKRGEGNSDSTASESDNIGHEESIETLVHHLCAVEAEVKLLIEETTNGGDSPITEDIGWKASAVGMEDKITDFVIEVVFRQLEHYQEVSSFSDFLRLVTPLPESLQKKLLSARFKIARVVAREYSNVLNDYGIHHVHTLAATALDPIDVPEILKKDIREAFEEMNQVEGTQKQQLPPLNTRHYSRSVTINRKSSTMKATPGSRQQQLVSRMQNRIVEEGKKITLEVAR